MACEAPIDLARDKALLRSGKTYLLAEACAKAALSIELITAPLSDDLPHAGLQAALEAALGGFDELADDRVPASS